MDPFQVVAFGVLLPATLCGVVLVAGLGLLRPGVEARPAQWPWPLALGLGYAAAHVAIAGAPALPPVGSVQWLFVLVAAMALVHCIPWPDPLRILPTAATLAAGSALLANPGASSEALLRGAALAVAWPVFILLLDVERRRLPAAAWLGVVFVVGLGASVTVAFTGSAKLGQLAGAVVSTLGACGVLLLWSRKLPIGAGATAVVATALGGIGVAAWLYSELPPSLALLLLAGPLLASASAWLPAPLLARTGEGLTAVVLALLPSALAAGIAALAFFGGDVG